MKSLEKLKLHNFDAICVEDQRAIIGGGSWVTIDGVTTWCCDEVVVTGSYTDLNTPTTSVTTTYCSFVNQGIASNTQIVGSAVVGLVPVAGTIWGIGEDKIASERQQVISSLLAMGYACADTFTFQQIVTSDLGIYFNVYDPQGNFVLTTKN